MRDARARIIASDSRQQETLEGILCRILLLILNGCVGCHLGIESTRYIPAELYTMLFRMTILERKPEAGSQKQEENLDLQQAIRRLFF